MNNFYPNNILTIYKINTKSLINIGYKSANRKEKLCFLIRISGIFNTSPQQLDFLYVFDKISVELLHIMHYSQRVMEIS